MNNGNLEYEVLADHAAYQLDYLGREFEASMARFRALVAEVDASNARVKPVLDAIAKERELERKKASRPFLVKVAEFYVGGIASILRGE